MTVTPTKREFEYIVIGWGGLGSGAAYWLARRAGAEVLGLEQFALGHDNGASEDHSRIIRLSYHTPAYVELARHAYTAWRAVEENGGERLLVISGGLDLWPHDAAIPMSDYTESMDAQGVPYERLDADEIMRRWPRFRLADDVVGVYQADGGIVPARKSNALHIRLARRYGATILENTPVTGVTARDGGVEVSTSQGVYRCRALVLAADAWTNGLLAPLGLRLPLTMTQEQVTYYTSSRLSEFAPARFPEWIWMDDPSFYGLPVYGEEGGVKVAQDVGGRQVTLETRTFDPNPATLARTTAFARRILPGIDGPPLYSKTCLYTLTPDRDFVIDTLPAYPHISLALGAGHAFKFASVIGRILSELAIDGTTEYDIAPFAVDRPIFTMEDPPTHFLV